MKPLIISAYSNDHYYQQASESFSAGLAKYNIEHKLFSFSDKGNWHANCRMKASIIHEALNSTKKPILWIDVDALILKPIDLIIPKTVDMMGIRQAWGPKRTWCVGTLAFNYSENSLQFIEDWKNKCEAATGGTDEQYMEEAWQSIGKDKLNTKELDLKYFHLKVLHGPPNHNTVILHRSSGRARKK